MPVKRAWRRLGPARQIGLVATGAILLVGAVAVAIISYGRGGCVSDQLIARNGTQVANLEATDDYSAAQLKYITDALSLQDRTSERAAFKQLGAQTEKWHEAVHAARVAAEKHPLGHC